MAEISRRFPRSDSFILGSDTEAVKKLIWWKTQEHNKTMQRLSEYGWTDSQHQLSTNQQLHTNTKPNRSAYWTFQPDGHDTIKTVYYKLSFSIRWYLSIVSARGEMSQTISECGAVNDSLSFISIPIHPCAVDSASKWCDQRKWHLKYAGDKLSPDLTL